MYITAHQALIKTLLPSLEKFKGTLKEKVSEYENIIKIGRTHLQDNPFNFGTEFSGFVI